MNEQKKPEELTDEEAKTLYGGAGGELIDPNANKPKTAPDVPMPDGIANT